MRRTRQPIDPMTAADSVVSLLDQLKVKELPPEERMAVAEAKIRYGKARLAAWKQLLSGHAAQPQQGAAPPSMLQKFFGFFRRGR
jgi:hypothetical protein